MPELEFDFNAVYKVEGHEGIAFRAYSYAKEWTEENWELLEGIDEFTADVDYNDPDNYVYNEPEEIEDRTRVLCYMIGDDRTFDFEISELTKLEEDEYCPECGQIGCKAWQMS